MKMIYIPPYTRSSIISKSGYHLVISNHPEVNRKESEWKLTPVPLVHPLIDGSADAFAVPGTGGGVPGWIARDDSSIGVIGAA